MAGVRGDWQGLADLHRRLGALASPSFTDELAHRLAATGIKLMADEFRESRDPYGNPWAPVVRTRLRDRRARARAAKAGRPVKGDKPLIDTGRLRAAATAKSADRSGGAAIRISIPVAYASFHQDGTKRMVRRQIVPSDATGGLGQIWRDAFNREVARAVNERMKGGG